MSRINRLIERFRDLVLGRTGQSNERVSDLPLDHQLSFKRDAQEEWSFKEGRILLNGEDVEDVLDKSRNEVGFQTAVSEAISEYKDMVRSKGTGDYSDFMARAEGVQGKILGNMKRIYDECMGGVRLSYSNGTYHLNNINIRAIVAMFRVRPTERAFIYLEGLKAKLALLLASKNDSPRYESVHRVVKTLYAEVDSALNETAVNVPRLPAPNRNSAV